ncbi:MAG: ATP-dependent nuclease [Candidatus Altimarinota bacterium]
MKIIEKIEISYFRSFKNIVIYDLKDLNIFSGANDAGKSNILRALNLFFNNEVNYGSKLDMFSDFNFDKNQENKGQKKPKKYIDITLHFLADNHTKYRQNKFSIKKRWNSDGEHSTTVFKDDKGQFEIYNIYREATIYKKSDAKQRLQSINRFLNSIHFYYVPAIKDDKFFARIFGKILSGIKGNQELLNKTDILDNINGLEKAFNNESEDILKQSMDLNVNFSVPLQLEGFFSGFDIRTEDGGKISVSIKSRGDGIQAKIIPNLLELMEKNEQNKTKYKQNIIWGFEEPENSYEMKNVIKLKHEFIEKFSKNRQIFITTHSIEFLAINSENSSIYRVWKDNCLSNIAYFDNTKESWDKYCDDFGIIKDARDINTMIEEKYKLEKMQNELLKEDIPIVLVEDEYDQIYKIAYLKLKGIECKEADFERLFQENSSFLLFGKNGAQNLQKFLNQPKIDELANKKIIGIFDFDAQGVNEFHGLQKNDWGKVDDKKINKSEGWYKQKGNINIYAMLLPARSFDNISYSPNEKPNHINENYLAIEELLNYNNPKIAGFYKEEKIFGGKVCYKKFNGKKGEFWKKLFDLQKEDFKDFKPLFKKIYELFGIEDEEGYFNS